MSFPEFTEDMTTDEKLDETRSYLFMMMEALRYLMQNLDSENFNETGLKEITEPITAKIQDVAGNVTELEVTAEGLKSSVKDVEGKASTAQQTADGVKVDVQNLKSRNTVTIDATGLYVTDAWGNTTKLSGNQITSGTIEGVTLISRENDGISTSLQSVTIQNGQITLKSPNGDTATIAETYSGLQISSSTFFGGGISISAPTISLDGSVMVEQFINSNGVMKLNAGSNASFDANGTLYLGVSNYGENVEIGGSGSTINLNGTVLINGVPLSTGGASE